MFKVIKPLVVIANSDGKSGDFYGYVDAIIPEGWNDERCKQLVKEGFLEKVSTPKADAPDDPDAKSDKVDDILKEVGDDKGKAQAALDVEQAKGDKARKTLVEPLEKILAG